MVVQNAWKRVIEEGGLDSMEAAKRLFENLKKCFQRRRSQTKGLSGTSTEFVAEAKERLQELAYLSWLEPFIILRKKPKSNCPTFKEGVRDIDEESSRSRMIFLLFPRDQKPNSKKKGTKKMTTKITKS